MREAIGKIPGMTLWLWNSPTFTTWGNSLIQSLRLLILTPLILTHLSEIEITAWYLFASLNVFGAIMTQRIGLTFSRMIAFAMGGASSLGVISARRQRENEGQPNWELVERTCGAVGVLTLFIALVNLLVASSLGWYGLGNILRNSVDVHPVWIAFFVFVSSSLPQFTFVYYQTILQGMNHVALVNRWGVLWGIFSCLTGLVVLLCGGGIIALTVGMQLVMLVGLAWDRWLLHRVEGGRMRRFRAFQWDRQIAAWAWEPTWKGVVAQFGLLGNLQIIAIIYSTFATNVELAGYLFALRMIQTLVQFSQAPFTAVQPLMSRMRASGDIDGLRRVAVSRIAASLFLMLAGTLILGLLLEPVLVYIGGNISFIPRPVWFLWGGLMILLRFDVLCSAICASGNEIVFYWDMGLAAIIGQACLLLIQNQWGYYGPVLASVLPVVLILNVRPYRRASAILK